MNPNDYKEHAPLLFHPMALAKYCQHDPTWPTIAGVTSHSLLVVPDRICGFKICACVAILGGKDRCQWSQLDFRESPAGASPGWTNGKPMRFHRDNGHDKLKRTRSLQSEPAPPHYIAVVTFLSDVLPDSPCLCVIPRSNQCAAQSHADVRVELEASADLGCSYREVEMRVSAGTAVYYDVATFHTRLDPPGSLKGNVSVSRRRSMHRYYSRSPAPPRADTAFQLVPPFLAEIPTHKHFFGNHTRHQLAWAASGFRLEYLQEHAAELLLWYLRRDSRSPLQNFQPCKL
eukprot:SAG31_NODE_3824_length_3849_cov_2.006400_3_plen_288_part_00